MKTIPYDKTLHYMAGSFAALVGVTAATPLRLPLYAGAIFLALAAGLARELYNVYTGTEWSNSDIAWTVLGAVPVGLAVMVASLVVLR